MFIAQSQDLNHFSATYFENTSPSLPFPFYYIHLLVLAFLPKEIHNFLQSYLFPISLWFLTGEIQIMFEFLSGLSTERKPLIMPVGAFRPILRSVFFPSVSTIQIMPLLLFSVETNHKLIIFVSAFIKINGNIDHKAQGCLIKRPERK